MVKAATRRLRRWPAASLDCGYEPAQRPTIGTKDRHERVALDANYREKSMT
jgi:hypothetical protein